MGSEPEEAYRRASLSCGSERGGLVAAERIDHLTSWGTPWSSSAQQW